jgi:Tfp pilus assembly protein PilF
VSGDGWGTFVGDGSLASRIYYVGRVPVRQAATQDISGHLVTVTPNASPKETRLDSWKTIAAFFGKDERTVKRWEKERGLPVRRVPGVTRGTVFAYTKELERWLAGTDDGTPIRVAETFIPGALTERNEAAAGATAGAGGFASESIEEASAQTGLGQGILQTSWPRVLLGAAMVLSVAGFLIYSSVGHREIRFNTALAARHQPDSTAQDLYLKGRFYFEKRTPNDLNTAVDAFTQAIVHDPGYAQAYVGLADTYSLLREYSTMPALEAEQRARAAAQRAVGLDPNLAEAHTSLAFAEFWGFLDAADADREFRRAIELDPKLARAHHWYATFLNAVLRTQDALAEIERARQLDPSSKAILADKGVLLLEAGHRDEARSLLQQMEASDPNFRSSHQYLGRVYWDGDNYEAALDEFRKEASLRGNEAAVKAVLARQQALRTGGVQGLFEYQLTAALRSYQHENGSAVNVASAYGELRQRDETLKFLEVARQRHDLGLSAVEAAPEFRWLHSDPQFRRLMTETGLPPLP